jgi:hypothetical protein
MEKGRSLRTGGDKQERSDSFLHPAVEAMQSGKTEMRLIALVTAVTIVTRSLVNCTIAEPTAHPPHCARRSARWALDRPGAASEELSCH